MLSEIYAISLLPCVLKRYLDLYVCNYAEVDLAKYSVCEHGPKKIPFSCPPWNFPAVSHRLYRNTGDGTFADVTEASGIAAASPAPGLGVVLTDLDGDGRIDIYVANDLRPAYLFHNQGGGRFVEKALFSSCGLGSSGENIAGMGVEAGDVDGSGRRNPPTNGEVPMANNRQRTNMKNEPSSNFRVPSILRVELVILGLLGVSLLDEHRALGQDRSAAAELRPLFIGGAGREIVQATVTGPQFQAPEFFQGFEDYYHPRLKQLRDEYQVDKIVAGETNELTRAPPRMAACAGN